MDLVREDQLRAHRCSERPRGRGRYTCRYCRYACNDRLEHSLHQTQHLKDRPFSGLGGRPECSALLAAVVCAARHLHATVTATGMSRSTRGSGPSSVTCAHASSGSHGTCSITAAPTLTSDTCSHRFTSG
ncbi:uncharacterized protein LOC119169112 isoform X3 [Rhipicephalus microplus]|uniref:uncharacterized protein LOC119169112 isoform X3 n=1 Tax=Rhipicephalus microplus TaxID=6941 RepID=UPI003F6D5948